MNFETMREWLARRLAHTDDTAVAAGGTSIEELRQDAQARTVTPAVLAAVPSQIGKVVRYVREQRGWTRRNLADLADVDEVEIVRIESELDVAIPPRSLVNLADVCGFSVRRFQELAKHVSPRTQASSETALRFAARSANIASVTSDEFDAVVALVEVLTDRASETK
jgi:transcriptional regulator with XRE-family HTH domain